VEEQTQQNVEKERLLIQQSRSAAMGEMISNIAHQWRQPLSTLGLIVQNILLDYRENQLIQEELEKYVDTALQCVTLMSETIDDFRNFFLPDKAKVFFNLKQAIDESLRLLEATLKNNNIKVLLDGDAGMHTFGHANEFSQVILNLLANAKDALMINKVPHGRIEIELRSADNIGIVMIRDNAGGIPEETLEKIFDPYFTTKIGGTGIGLYMSKTIIEKHMGGSIVCRNTPDGAEFTVSIPLGENHNAEPE
jgi:signal transduction histidine kinase